MSLLVSLLGGALDKLAPVRLPQLQTERCLRHRFLHNACQRCLEACTYGAWQAKEGAPPELYSRQCTGCGLCVPACPVDGISFSGLEYGLLLTRLEREGEKALLTCAAQDRMGYIRVPCLGYLPWEVLASAALNGKTVVLTCGPCSSCGHRDGEKTAREQVAMANAFLRGIGAPGWVVLVQEGDQDNRRDQPVFDRRELFQLLSAEMQLASAQLLLDKKAPGQDGAGDIPERKFLLQSALQKQDQKDLSTAIPGTVAFWSLRVAGKCTGCGLCANACPTRALRLEEKAEEQMLLHQTLNCTGCGLCQELCPHRALEIKSYAGGIASVREKVVAHLELPSCSACGATLAIATGRQLCPQCFLDSTPWSGVAELLEYQQV